jgi:hypothetical protein
MGVVEVYASAPIRFFLAVQVPQAASLCFGREVQAGSLYYFV